MRPRRSLVLGLGAAATLTLSACSPPVSGLLGFSVRDGRMILLVQSCEAPIVEVWITGDNAGDGFLEREQVTLDSSAEGLVEHDLGPVEEFVASLDPDLVYSVRGWAEGSSVRAVGPAVRADELAGWGDDVLYPRDGVSLEHAIGPVEEFSATACD